MEPNTSDGTPEQKRSATNERRVATGADEIERAFEDSIATSEAFQNLREQVQDLDGVVIESLERLEQLESKADYAEALSKKVEHLEKRIARLENGDETLTDGYGDGDPVEIPEPADGAQAVTGPQAPDGEFSGGPK